MVQPMKHATFSSVALEPKRIEGQVRSILRMVESGRGSGRQRSAPLTVSWGILADHLSHCVTGLFSSSNLFAQRRKVEKFVNTVERMTR